MEALRRTIRSLALTVAVLGLSVGLAPAWAAPIPVLNGDFEIVYNEADADVGPSIVAGWYSENLGPFVGGTGYGGGSGPVTGSVPGWISDNSGGFAHGVAKLTSASLTPVSLGAYLSYPRSGLNTLSATLEPERVYMLSVDIGKRSDFGTQSQRGGFEWNGADYTVDLLANGVSLPLTGANPNPAPGTYATGTWTYTSPAAVTPGQVLAIRVRNDSATQMLFDNVALEVRPIPEPASLGLLLGTTALALLRRRGQSAPRCRAWRGGRS